MTQNPPEGYSRITPYLLYEDGAAAIDFLTRAFGFTERMRMPNEQGGVAHAELEFERELLMLGTLGDNLKSPKTSGVDSLAFVHLYVDDVDAHFARAKEAGAEIIREPEDQFYGDRTYGAKDPEGMSWYFAQHVRDVSPEEMSAAMAESSAP
ncbi:MAG: VOC family protein [Actinobacteria bacterium]|nr:VOC family protein [Actinomycetota bacterium]